MGKSNDAIVQMQEADENSQQIQVGTVVVNQGITEKRAREVFTEMIPQVLEDYAQEAYATANSRIEKLEDIVVPRILETDNAISSLSDPVIQLMLKRAQQTAAATEREDDYSLLSELIVCQIQKGADRKNRTGIKKAIEIVGDVDVDALCALTVAHAINVYLPASGNVREGISALDNLFSRLFQGSLPNGVDWLDHLDVLGALRLSKIMTLRKLKDFYTDSLNGYACTGIRIDSEEYKKSMELLVSTGLGASVLQENELLEGYVRIPVANKEGICKLSLVTPKEVRPITEKEITVLETIWDMYDLENTLREKVKDSFMKLWDSYDALKCVHVWWDDIPFSFEITKVGTVLAHTNAKRCDSGLPDLL